MRDTKLVIFGSPTAGTPVVVAAPLAALDLPLEVLVWADGSTTKISYTAPRALAARYWLSGGLADRLAGMTRGRTPSSKCKTVEPLHNYVSGGALPSNRFGDRTSIDAHKPQLTAEVDSVTIEEQARCRGMLLAAPHERNAVGIEDTEVADQLVEATAVAGRRDHRIGLCGHRPPARHHFGRSRRPRRQSRCARP